MCVEVDERGEACSEEFYLPPGTYYIPFRWREYGPPGTYVLKVTLYIGAYRDYKEFPYTVRSPTEEEREEMEEQKPWYEKSVAGVPVWAWIGLAGGISVAVAVVAAVMEQERRREMMMLALLSR